jgi:hypothetical protein
MEWFINLQFFSGLIIGLAFGLVGGLLLGLVVGAPIANEIMAAEGASGGSGNWDYVRKPLRRKSSEVLDMTPPARSESMAAARTRESSTIDMTPRPEGARAGSDIAEPVLPPPPEAGIVSGTDRARGSGTGGRV